MGRTPRVAAALALIGAVAAAGAFAGGDGHRPDRRSFTVKGSVSGLYPGRSVLLPAVVRNRSRRPIRLVYLTARVRDPGRTCTRHNLEVRPFHGRFLIPGRRSRVVRLRVRMPETAAPECRGARFPLVFSGRAVTR
jgi:hypothetical protein